LARRRLRGHDAQEAADLALVEAAVATQRADGGELAGVRPAGHRLGVDAEENRDLGRGEEGTGVPGDHRTCGRSGCVGSGGDHGLLLSFGSSADPGGPEALRPLLAEGLPFSLTGHTLPDNGQTSKYRNASSPNLLTLSQVSALL